MKTVTNLRTLAIKNNTLDTVASSAIDDTNLLHGHSSAEHSSDGEVSTMSWITRCHHVLSVEHLLDELRDGQGAVLLAAAGRQRSEAGHEEVKSREWYHVDGQLAKIGIELLSITSHDSS